MQSLSQSKLVHIYTLRLSTVIHKLFAQFLLHLSYYIYFFMLGANKCVYAPEPIDVGRVLQADIASNGLKVTLTTDGPIEQGRQIIGFQFYKIRIFWISHYPINLFDVLCWKILCLFCAILSITTKKLYLIFIFSFTALDLGSYVETLLRKPNYDFSVCHFISLQLVICVLCDS